MVKTNDGGAAFPTIGVTPQGDTVGELGMSIRYAFAIAVRQSMGTWTPDFEFPVDEMTGQLFPIYSLQYELAARASRAVYAIAEADALIAALEKKDAD